MVTQPGDAFRDPAITAVSEEENALRRAKITRSLAVEMEDLVSAERKGVISRNGLTASRAVRFSHGLTLDGRQGSTLRVQPLGYSSTRPVHAGPTSAFLRGAPSRG